jgi:diacylglycerol O-acyltransferase / wax synthase
VPLYMAGAQLTHQYGMAPLANNMGLFIATPSYNGRISFSIICERAIMPDIAFFRQCIDDSFAEMLGAVPREGGYAVAEPPPPPKPAVRAKPKRPAKSKAATKAVPVKPAKTAAKTGKTKAPRKGK